MTVVSSSRRNICGAPGGGVCPLRLTGTIEMGDCSTAKEIIQDCGKPTMRHNINYNS